MRMPTGFVLLAVSLLAGAGNSVAAVPPSPVTPQAAAACERDCLVGTLARYLDALVAHRPAAAPLAAAYKATQNGQPAEVGADLWQSARAIDMRQYFADPSAGQVAMFGLVREGTASWPIMVRIKVVSGRITEIETIVPRDGPGQLLPKGPALPNPIFDELLKPEERVSRATLAAVAQQYFDGLERHNGDIVPWDTTCNRRENYVQKTNDTIGGAPLGCGDSVTHYMYHIKAVIDRRSLIVDEDRGLAFAIVHLDRRAPDTHDPLYFARSLGSRQIQALRSGKSLADVDPAPVPYTPSFLLLGELFKIRAGKIRDIEAIMFTQPPHSPTGWTE